MDKPSARYISLISTLLIVCLVLGVTHLTMSRQRVQFFELEPALSFYPMKEQVTNFMCVASNLIIFAILLGIVTIFTSSASKLKHYLWKKSQIDVHLLQIITLILWHSMGIALSIIPAQACVGILKNLVGRARPNTFYMCNYLGYRDAVDSHNMEKYLSLTKPNTMGNVDNCYDKGSTNEAFLSFPSGHASLSFAAMVYCCFLIRTVLDIRPGVFYSVHSLVSYLPLLFSAWVSITRVQDHWHHEDDVTVGAIIGLLCGCVSITTISTYISMDSVKVPGSYSASGDESREQDNDEDPLLPL